MFLGGYGRRLTYAKVQKSFQNRTPFYAACRCSMTTESTASGSYIHRVIARRGQHRAAAAGEGEPEGAKKLGDSAARHIVMYNQHTAVRNARTAQPWRAMRCCSSVVSRCSFLKKRTEKLLSVWLRVGWGSWRQAAQPRSKSFLLLFFKKEDLFS